MRHLITGLLVLALAGCASEQNQQLLAHYLWECQQGDQWSCDAVPVQQRINQDEATANAARTAAVILLLPLAIAGAAYADSGPHYHYYPRYHHRWR